MIPLKFAFSVTIRKVSQYCRHHHDILIDQSKVDAIQNILELRNL